MKRVLEETLSELQSAQLLKCCREK